MRSPTHLPLILLAALAGCGQAPDLSAELDLYVEHVNDARGGICMCPVDAGFDTAVDCGEALSFVGDAEVQCMSAALEEYGEDGSSYLACVSSAYDDGAACLAANTACEDGQVAACEQAREISSSACSQIPDTGRNAFQACIGS